MSLVLLSLAGAAGLWHTTRTADFQRRSAEKHKKKDQWASTVGQRFEMSTGTYGDISQVSNLINKPGYVVGQRMDVDLTGVPCRWLIMRNGGVYKTYDMDTDYF